MENKKIVKKPEENRLLKFKIDNEREFEGEYIKEEDIFLKAGGEFEFRQLVSEWEYVKNTTK
jgi:hypothetical protein